MAVYGEFLMAAVTCWDVARKRREHYRPESGVPISVSPSTRKALL